MSCPSWLHISSSSSSFLLTLFIFLSLLGVLGDRGDDTIAKTKAPFPSNGIGMYTFGSGAPACDTTRPRAGPLFVRVAAEAGAVLP
jgi:hypothetical protein